MALKNTSIRLVKNQSSSPETAVSELAAPLYLHITTPMRPYLLGRILRRGPGSPRPFQIPKIAG